MSAFGSGPSNGQFYFGQYGFLYKKNVGVGGRRSTLMGPGGNLNCNGSTYLYNKFRPGQGGIGASSISNRRAKNRLATVCGPNKCFPCYNTLGQYSNNQNGIIPCPLTTNSHMGYDSFSIVQTSTIEPTETLFSKNNTSADGLLIGETTNKDMFNEYYYTPFYPENYPQIFPNMTTFTQNNIVAGDKAPDNILIASCWRDWGYDIFDNWGYFYIYDVETGKYYFPLIESQNQNDGVITTQTFNAFGRTFTITHGFPVQGIFKFDISVNDNKKFRFGAYGNMGFDYFGTTSNMEYRYTISTTNVTLYYNKRQDNSSLPYEILYSYVIPKNVNQNSSITFDYNNSKDYDSLVSKEVTNGLLVYFSKTNDVKEWVVNDLGLNP